MPLFGWEARDHLFDIALVRLGATCVNSLGIVFFARFFIFNIIFLIARVK